MFLRLQDIGRIWTLLSTIMQNSSQHNDSTDVKIFGNIVNAVAALIRLRRDLVAISLPQVISVLRRLISLLSQPRPQLGAMQHQMVHRKLPNWIHPSKPLGTAEAKMLSRLLETLKLKSIVRLPNRQEKADSLARTFSLHAPYIIQAYVELLNDELLQIGKDVVDELEPGMFVLCEISSIHARNAMMSTWSDAGSKAILKTLWQEYEKQRYIGKG